MAAEDTLLQLPERLQPRYGVITLFGYGVSVRVDRGHLILHDGIGAARREARLARVGHGLHRLIVIGSDGFVSLAAIRWLADQDAADFLDAAMPLACSVVEIGGRNRIFRKILMDAIRNDPGYQNG